MRTADDRSCFVTVEGPIERSAVFTLSIILLASIILKLIVIWYLDGRVYYDVVKAVNFGYLVHQKSFSIDADIINSKTFLGPLIWFHLYQSGGVVGLQLFNVLVFILLFVTVYALGKRRYSTPTIILGLFLFAFYAGTNRNIAAGEPDDNIAALFFGLGVLVYLKTTRVFPTSLLMGLAFLFKFWIAVFCLGFVVYLVAQGRLKHLWRVGLGMALPFLLINCIDGLQSMRSLLVSLGVQKGISPWQDVGFKMLSTGMIFSMLASAWTWFKHKNEPNTLFFVIPATYFLYIVLNRDAFAASFVMMQCLMFSSFLIAEFLLMPTILRHGRFRSGAIGVFCAAYLGITAAITYQHIYRDTVPLALVKGQPEIESMFWHRKL
jgi:hypothetical protein